MLYLGTAVHIVLWIIAVLCIVFVSIAFTVFLLCAPLIMRKFSLTRIKPFLDEFQGLYKDEYRWMAGYYFLCRLLNYVVIIEPTTNQLAGIYVLQMVSVVIALFHCVLQPYKIKILNLVDGIFLIDLVFVSLLQGRTAEVVLGSVIELRNSFTIILTLVPFAYLILLVFIASASKFHIIQGAFVSFWSYTKDRVLTAIRSYLPGDEPLNDPNADRFPPREPLLEYVGNDGDRKRSRLPTTSSFHPSYSTNTSPDTQFPT